MQSRSDTESEGLANTRKGQKRNIHAPEDAGLVVGEQRERMAKRRKHLEGEWVEEVEGGDEAESDWYSVLGIQPGCSDRDVRNARHNLVVKWHPDKAVGNQDEASRTVARINEAYNALRTAESRGEYEARRSTNGGCGRGGGVTGDF
jgi:DnaJ-domain-containing protein 1